ncbi:hypothetical protein Csa_005391, partial [Cucumis sativus]
GVLALRGRLRRGRQVTTVVHTTGSTNEAQECNEISRNPHDPVEQNEEESMFIYFAQRLTNKFMPICTFHHR